MNRSSADDASVTAFDFVRPEEEAAKLERIREGKKYIKKAIGSLPWETPRTKLLDVRRKAITDLTASGYKDAEALFDSVWPHLKPTEEERNEA